MVDSEKKHKNDKIIMNPKKYFESNTKFQEAVRSFHKNPDMKASNITEKFYYYNKADNTVSPSSHDD
jgi:hypothetical protein